MNERISTTVQQPDQITIRRWSDDPSDEFQLKIMMDDARELFDDAYRDNVNGNQTDKARRSKLAVLEYVRELVVDAIGAVKSELPGNPSDDLAYIEDHGIALREAEEDEQAANKKRLQEQADDDAERRAETERHTQELADTDAKRRASDVEAASEAYYRNERDAAVKRHKVAERLHKREAVKWEVLNACFYARLNLEETQEVLREVVTEGDRPLQQAIQDVLEARERDVPILMDR